MSCVVLLSLRRDESLKMRVVCTPGKSERHTKGCVRAAAKSRQTGRSNKEEKERGSLSQRSRQRNRKVV